MNPTRAHNYEPCHECGVGNGQNTTGICRDCRQVVCKRCNKEFIYLKFKTDRCTACRKWLRRHGESENNKELL